MANAGGSALRNAPLMRREGWRAARGRGKHWADVACRPCLHRWVLLLAWLLAPAIVAGQEQQDRLRFLGNAMIPPMISLVDGKPAGVVVDLAYAIAKKSGLSVNVEAMDWLTAQADLAGGKADALLQIDPNPAREAMFDFSDVLLDSAFSLFHKSSRADIDDLPSLQGKKVGVERGGFPYQYLKEHPGIRIFVIRSWKSAFEMLGADHLDAVLVDRRVGDHELYAHKISGVIAVERPLVTSWSRIAVRKGDARLLERINFGLKEIDRDGTRRAILDKWRTK